jgi:YfiH family protein
VSVHLLQENLWPKGVVAGFTVRGGGVSSAPWDSFNLGDHVGDNPQSVARNRASFLRTMPDTRHSAWLTQEHGSTVVRAGPGVPVSDTGADGSWTDECGIACVVLTADCLPVLFCTSDGSVVAAAHAGWRGLAAGILEATLEAMPAAPSALLAWLGPCIGACHYRVGDDVRRALATGDVASDETLFRATGDGAYLADLRAVARQRLTVAGVAQVTQTDQCTVCESTRFFSYRRDGETGRMATFVYRQRH